MHQTVRGVALSLALGASPASASAACVSAVSPLSETRLTEASVPAAAVTGWTDDIAFLKDKSAAPGCPEETPACEDAARIAPGQFVVLNGFPVGDFVCATYSAPGGAVTTEWLPILHLALIARSVPGADEWAGEWTTAGKSIAIRLTASGELSLSGEHTSGGGFEARLEPGGAVLGFTAAANRTLAYDQGEPSDCRMQLVRRGPYLVAKDNAMCGGRDATFTGLYRRR